MEKNCIARGEGAFELKKSGSVRPHESEEGKCIMMDLSEMKTWMSSGTLRIVGVSKGPKIWRRPLSDVSKGSEHFLG